MNLWELEGGIVYNHLPLHVSLLREQFVGGHRSNNVWRPHWLSSGTGTEAQDGGPAPECRQGWEVPLHQTGHQPRGSQCGGRLGAAVWPTTLPSQV